MDAGRDQQALEPETRVRLVLREAKARASPGAIRETFEQAVAREIAHMLERGMPRAAIIAFEEAAAQMHHALCPHGMRPCLECGDE
jgi:maltooligosyltrehalose synthase